MLHSGNTFTLSKNLRGFLLPCVLLIISITVGLLLWQNIKDIRHHNLEVATNGARNIFQFVVLVRQWTARHGGVYVLSSESTPPNPYLKHPHRDLTTTDDRKLTMLNPAYVTRQLAELADQNVHMRLHITSLNPIRPANAADEWETEALNGFEQGELEKVSIEPMQNIPYIRYMAPLMVTEECMKCHAAQGYQVGDIRGGISVSLNYKPIEQAIDKEIRKAIISHSVFFILFVLVSWTLIRLLSKHWKALDSTIETLQMTRNELVENEKMASLGRLVAGFSHEINTPIGVALGAITHGDQILEEFTDLLQKDEVTEEEVNSILHDMTESHDLALANLKRAAELVFRFKRTSIDRSAHTMRDFMLSEVIDDVLASMRNILKHSSVKLQVNCSEQLKLHGTPGLLEQVLTNLIDNSLKHGFGPSQNQGEIHIDVESKPDNLILIRFRDNGLGMEEHIRQKIFEPFFTTKHNQGGSGLGLYIIYNIITQQLHGTIHVESTLESGTEFIIEFPQTMPELPTTAS